MGDRANQPLAWVLLGHRACGKTTLGELAAAALKRRFVDVDRVIEKRTNRSPAEWIASSLPEFRSLEVAILSGIEGPAVISPGAGIESVPCGLTGILIERAGWEKDIGERVRVRKDLGLFDEIRWMRETREPSYVRWADAVMRVPSYETVEVSARRLCDLILRLERSRDSALIRKSFLIGHATRLDRQIPRSSDMGACGVEVRTDIFEPSNLDGIGLDEEKVLFSVRSALPWPDAGRFPHRDVDRRFLHSSQTAPTIVSDHPSDWREPAFPPDAADVKWAPTPPSFADLPLYSDRVRELRRKHLSVTVLPQTPRWTWLRILEALGENRWNFISGTCEPNETGTPTWSTWSLYAHASPSARRFGLIGDPVDGSEGPVFHNSFFQDKRIDALYLAVSVPTVELCDALMTLKDLRFEGLSVTAPHKRAVLDLPGVTADALSRRLGCANTLKADGGGWLATNTDVFGMIATLALPALEGARRFLVVGRGGVSPAVVEALGDLRGAEVVHVGARESAAASEVWRRRFDAVINASGRDVDTGGRTVTRVWVDLRYGSAARNDGGEVFVAGDTFFKAQAEAQREFFGFRGSGP